MKNGKILIIEQESIIALELKIKLEAKGYQVVASAKSGEDGIKLAADLKPDLILTEIVFHGKMDGIDAITRIRKHKKVPFIYVTTLSYLESDPRLLATEPVDLIAKPVDDAKLFKTIEKVLPNPDKS